MIFLPHFRVCNNSATVELRVSQAEIGVSTNMGDTLRISPWGQVSLGDYGQMVNLTLVSGRVQNRGRFVLYISSDYTDNVITAASYICRLDSMMNGFVPSYYQVPSTRFAGSSTMATSFALWRVLTTNFSGYVSLEVVGRFRVGPYPTDAFNNTARVFFLPGTQTEAISTSLVILMSMDVPLLIYHQGIWNSRPGSNVAFGSQLLTGRSYYQLFHHTGVINLDPNSLLRLGGSHLVLDGVINNAGGDLEIMERCPQSARCDAINNLCTCWLVPHMSLNASNWGGYGTLSLGRNVIIDNLNLVGWKINTKEISWSYNSTLTGRFTNCNVTLFNAYANATITIVPTAPATFLELFFTFEIVPSRPPVRSATPPFSCCFLISFCCPSVIRSALPCLTSGPSSFRVLTR